MVPTGHPTRCDRTSPQYPAHQVRTSAVIRDAATLGPRLRYIEAYPGPRVVYVPLGIPYRDRRFGLGGPVSIPCAGDDDQWTGLSLDSKRPVPPCPPAALGGQFGVLPGATLIKGNVDPSNTDPVAGKCVSQDIQRAGWSYGAVIRDEDVAVQRHRRQ